MKLRVPEGCHAVSHAARAIEIAEDGSVEVEDEARNVLISHGFIPWEGGQETPNLAPMTRDQLVSRAMNMTMKTIEAISTDDIRARLVVAEASMPPDGHEDASNNITILALGVEDISSLNRRELFSFLKAKGVSVSLPVTNEELRAAARHALVG
ncbi:MAG: hypothetical protein ACLQFI_08745 [Methylocella sp.]